jgi:hypothetical protein
MYDMRVLHEDKKEREKIEQIKKRIAVFSYDFSREPAYA